jgi:manganese oxidase
MKPPKCVPGSPSALAVLAGLGSPIPPAAHPLVQRRTAATAVALMFGVTTGASVTAAAAPCDHLPPVTATAAEPNDNRAPAGVLRDGVHTLQLVAGPTAWYPEGPDGCALRVNAFAEEGAAPRVPGPLIRVPVGTEVRVSIRNALTGTLRIRGLQDRTADTLDAFDIAPGATRELRFRATVPGSYYYWGADTDAVPVIEQPLRRPIPFSNVDGQLVGALIVDAPEGARNDRVFVMTRWAKPFDPEREAGPEELNAINGLSWPHTERLSLVVGDTVRWRVINASEDFHMMHLHGFHFLAHTLGDGVRERSRPRTVVTEGLGPGGTVTLEWTPERPGNWLFHCHLSRHMSPEQRLDRLLGGGVPGQGSSHANHAIEGMAGLLLGITVHPRPGEVVPEPAPPRRTLRLYANQRPRVFGEQPGYGFVLQEDERAPAQDSVRIPGSPIILRRGEPVEILAFNRTTDELTVHWHGLELERSYFDGVAGWSGTPGMTAPMIAAGDSFAVRFTPPRAGTFIYHIHQSDGERLVSGLYGPLLVVDPADPYDPATERTFIISESGPAALLAGGRLFVNGTTTPDPMELVVGTAYRFRVIAIPSDEALMAMLMGPAGPQQWRMIAKDGADVPPADVSTRAARLLTGPGETWDFAFTPTEPGDLSFQVYLFNGLPVGEPTVVPMRVRERRVRLPSTPSSDIRTARLQVRLRSGAWPPTGPESRFYRKDEVGAAERGADAGDREHVRPAGLALPRPLRSRR